MSVSVRILHIVTHMERGGLETMLMNYYRNIDKTKVQFDFIVHREYESAYDKEILSLGGKIYHISRLVPWSQSYKNELKKIFKEHPEYKIVHVHQDCLSSVALKCVKECDIPIRIAHSHSSSQDKNFKYLIKRYYMRSIPKYATHLFACGKEAGDWMFSHHQFEIVRNAINTELFCFDKNMRNILRKQYHIENDIIIGHVGRFNYPKNHEFLIDIFNEIHKRKANAKLLLIGSGDLEENIKSKVEKLGISDSVIFLGNRSDVNELLQVMDVFVFPSHYEGLPVTLIEAQASGLPIFKSTNVPNQCQITPYVYSLSLEQSSKEWAESILNCYQTFERKDTSKMIKEAGYDIQDNARKLQEFYISEVKKYE